MAGRQESRERWGGRTTQQPCCWQRLCFWDAERYGTVWEGSWLEVPRIHRKRSLGDSGGVEVEPLCGQTCAQGGHRACSRPQSPAGAHTYPPTSCWSTPSLEPHGPTRVGVGQDSSLAKSRCGSSGSAAALSYFCSLSS